MTPEIFREVNEDYEIIGGEKFMSPSADAWHNNAAGKLYLIIGMHVATNRLGLVFTDSLDVHFPDGNLFKPDFMFISTANSGTIVDNKHSTIHGVPDMVAEVFSRSTMKRDIGIKKEIYEQNGVKEYWLINPWSAEELKELTDEERAEIKNEVPVNVLDGFKVKIKNIFGWYLE